VLPTVNHVPLPGLTNATPEAATLDTPLLVAADAWPAMTRTVTRVIPQHSAVPSVSRDTLSIQQHLLALDNEESEEMEIQSCFSG